jgi:MinD-like ATPase involved in chromosome partitioning or flagellar assembly
MSAGRVITFYSYKGGVGRTQALASIGTLLSRWGYKVLCVDWDLEAPGLDRYFQRWLGQPQNPGVVELIHAHMEKGAPDWRDYVVELKLGSAGHPLYLMPAGVQDETYKRRIQGLDWSALYEKHELGAFLEQMRDAWKASYDFILVDSRTGITDIGGICTIQLPDQLVLLFTANHQSLEGIIDVWQSALAGRNDFAFDRGRLLALPVATRFEQRVEYERAQGWLRTFAEKLEPLFAEWASKEVSVPELLGFTRVPSVPYWSFGEDLPVIEEDGKNPEQLSFAFETLAALIANGLDGTDVLVRNRDAYVSAAWKVKPLALPSEQEEKPQKPVRLFLSYSFIDRKAVSQMLLHLGALQRQGIISDVRVRPISEGEHWKSELNVHLEEADIILFFLSADFLASEYAQGIEVNRALQRQKDGSAQVLPILLRPVHWEATPFARMQLLPRNGKPVSSHDELDEVWASISREIAQIAQDIRRPPERRSQQNVGLKAASFNELDSLLAELPGAAAVAGFPSDMAVKDVAVGPEDSRPFQIPRSELKGIVRDCTVELRGWGGANFPYGWYPHSREVHVPQGLRVVDTHPWPSTKASFHLWAMRLSGHFVQRQDMSEDFIEPSPGRPSPQGRLSMEWALLDIVRPLLFARNLLNRLEYPGRLAIKYQWSGLQGRSLIILNPRRVGFEFLEYVSQLPVWNFDCVIARDSDLYEAAHEAAESLFWQFGWEKAMSSAVPGDMRTLLEGKYPD